MSAVVHVKIEGSANRALETAAVLNGGFSSPSPHVLLPHTAALLLFPRYPAGTAAAEAVTAGGRVTLRLADEPAMIRIVTADREGPVASCQVVVAEDEDEVLLSDYAIDALGVEIKKHGEGIWRFADEERLRPSVPRQHW